MRNLLLATAVSLTFAATASTASAQYVIYDHSVPGASGATFINMPFYNGLAFNNGMVTVFPVAPRYGNGNPYWNPSGFPPYMARPPFAVGGAPSYNPYPNIWRP